MGLGDEPSKDTKAHRRQLAIPENLPENFSELSKNAQKRLLKRMHFEATRSEWKAKKREKKRARKLAAASENIQEEERDAASALTEKSAVREPPKGTIIFDMGFNDLMTSTVGIMAGLAVHIANSIRKWQVWSASFHAPTRPIGAQANRLTWWPLEWREL